ncbi:MAG: gas vesicle protein, partial [Gemmatimonadota bacterium]|nr:gas vesicle protein [Gemmatimonadota bacterium]
MSADDIFGVARIELAEVLSHVLDKGVVLRGEVMLAVADVDLIRLDLGLLLSAVESAMRQGGAGAKAPLLGSARPRSPA